jgi:hypothetical protein
VRLHFVQRPRHVVLLWRFPCCSFGLQEKVHLLNATPCLLLPVAAACRLLIFLKLTVLGNYPEQVGNPVAVPDDALPAAPMGGAPAGPPAAAAGGYGAPPMQQQNGGPPPGAGGMYGAPPQPAGNMYGAPPQQQQQNGGMYGGPPAQQQQQPAYRPPGGGGGGMYGGAPAGPQYGMGGGHGPVTQVGEPVRQLVACL